LISSLFAIQQSFEEETLYFENGKGVLSTIVQKKILDLDQVSISPPNPVPDNDVGPTTADSTIPSTTNSDTDFTASTFAEKYRDLLQKGGTRVLVLIKVAGDVESTDPAKRAKEIRNLQSYVLKFLSFSNGINIVSDQQKNEITGQIHPHWIEILEERTDVLSVTILGQYELSKNGVDPPRRQIANGVAPEEVICKEGLALIIKHNQSPACVRFETAEKLEERGWGGMPPPCCKEMHEE